MHLTANRPSPLPALHRQRLCPTDAAAICPHYTDIYAAAKPDFTLALAPPTATCSCGSNRAHQSNVCGTPPLPAPVPLARALLCPCHHSAYRHLRRPDDRALALTPPTSRTRYRLRARCVHKLPMLCDITPLPRSALGRDDSSPSDTQPPTATSHRRYLLPGSTADYALYGSFVAQ